MQRKKILLWLVLAVIFVMRISEITMAEEGRMINFIRDEKALNEILTMVKSSGKTGLLYFTADWCGPCKILQRDVFNNAAVVSFVESNFLPFWIDNNNSKQPVLQKHYNVNAVPTMIFISNTGEEINRIIGYGGKPDEYLEIWAKSARKEDDIEILKIAFQKADSLKNIALQIIPKDEEEVWEHARKLFFDMDYKNAIPVYEYLTTFTLSDSVKEAWKYLNLGQCYERIGDQEKAFDYYIKVVDKGLITNTHRKTFVYSRLGEICFQKRQYDSAIKYLQMLPEDMKEWGRMYGADRTRMYLPFVYAHLGQEQKGKNAIEEILKESYANKDYMSLAAFGQLCMINNLYLEEALPWAKKSVELAEWKDGYPLDAYASLAGLNQDYEEAIRTWNILLALPDNARNVRDRNRFQASANLAALYMKIGDIEKSEKLFQQLLEKSRENIQFLTFLAHTCYQHKVKLEDALKWAKQVVDMTEENYPALGMYLNFYANLLFENGEIQKAVEVGTEACEKSPHYRHSDDLDRFKAALK